jgi:hypothetical protein
MRPELEDEKEILTVSACPSTLVRMTRQEEEIGEGERTAWPSCSTLSFWGIPEMGQRNAEGSEGPRWEKRDWPMMGYALMVTGETMDVGFQLPASRQPLAASSAGFSPPALLSCARIRTRMCPKTVKQQVLV